MLLARDTSPQQSLGPLGRRRFGNSLRHFQPKLVDTHWLEDKPEIKIKRNSKTAKY